MSQKNGYMPTPPAPKSQAATKVWVERTCPRMGDKFEDKNIEVRLFETTPASVMAKVGQTLNLGNYESLRLDVGVTVPCYMEEVEEALEKASDIAGRFLMKEINAAKAALSQEE